MKVELLPLLQYPRRTNGGKKTYDFINDPRLWLSSPIMHGEEQRWVDEAIRTNWVSTVGANINEVEKQVAEKVGRKYAAALSAGTAALHLAIKIMW